MKRRTSRYNSGMARGDYENLEGDWTGVTAATGAGDHVYLVSNRALYALAGDGSARRFDGSWQTIALAPIGDALLAFEASGSLYRLACADGAWVEIDGNYPEVAAIAGAAGAVYAVLGPTLFRIEADGAMRELPGGWRSTKVLAGSATRLLAFDASGALYKIDPATGAYAELEGDWSAITAACIVGDTLYALSGGTLVAIDPDTGAWEDLGRGWGSQVLCAAGGALFAIEKSGNLFRIEVA